MSRMLSQQATQSGRKLSNREVRWLVQSYGGEEAQKIRELPRPLMWELYSDVLILGPKADRLQEMVAQMRAAFSSMTRSEVLKQLVRFASYDGLWWNLAYPHDWQKQACQLAATAVPYDEDYTNQSLGPLIAMIAYHDVHEEGESRRFDKYCQPYLKIQGIQLADLGIDAPELFPELNWS